MQSRSQPKLIVVRLPIATRVFALLLAQYRPFIRKTQVPGSFKLGDFFPGTCAYVYNAGDENDHIKVVTTGDDKWSLVRRRYRYLSTSHADLANAELAGLLPDPPGRRSIRYQRSAHLGGVQRRH